MNWRMGLRTVSAITAFGVGMGLYFREIAGLDDRKKTDGTPVSQIAADAVRVYTADESVYWSTAARTIPEPIVTRTEAVTAATAGSAPMTTECTTTTAASRQEVIFPLNLNTATLEELAALPEIGETIAGNIISYREAVGGFLNREQLLEVAGIGEVRYQAIYNLVYLDEESVIEEATEEEMMPGTTEWIPVMVDINDAAAEEFAQLPGISLELGMQFVDIRERIGGYTTVMELLLTDDLSLEAYAAIDEYLVCLPYEP